MNAYVQHQTSGQHWSAPHRAGTLLEQLARDSSRPVISWRPPVEQEHLILQDLERQMAEFAVEREAAVVELRKSFVLTSDSSVTRFLFEHRTLAPLLLEAVPELKRFFGQEAVFQLRAPLDPFGDKMLYSVAIWPGASTDVRTALESFDEAWVAATFASSVWIPYVHVRARMMAPAPFDWFEYYNIAVELSQRPEEAHKRTAISRAYYFVYHLGLQRAEANNFTRVSGESTHSQLWRIFTSSPEPACRRLGEIAIRLKEKRERADYNKAFRRVADEVPNVLADTQAFAEGLRNLPARHPNPRSVRI